MTLQEAILMILAHQGTATLPAGDGYRSMVTHTISVRDEGDHWIGFSHHPTSRQQQRRTFSTPEEAADWLVKECKV